MPIKGGSIVTIGNLVMLDRIQTGGPGQVNIPMETIYELGNYKSVGKVYDIPDLSYSVEYLDVAPEFEALLVGLDYSTDLAGTEYDLSKCLPIDVAGQFKPGASATSPYNVIGSAAAPYLYLESMSYRFGLRENGSQSASLRGDSIFYAPGSTFIEETAGTGSAAQEITLAHKAYPYTGDVVNGTRYTLGVSLKSGKRLRFGVDYTETVTGADAAKTVKITLTDSVAVSDKVRVVYASDTVATYPQNTHAVDSATRPSAVRGRHLRLYVNDILWTDVQSFNAEWRVQLDKDEEFGNDQVVSQDFDVPEVSGSIQLKPRSVNDLMEKLRAISGVSTATEVIGALQRVPLPVKLEICSPTDGNVLKTLYTPDARFTLPGFSGRVQAKTVWDINWASDSGDLRVYKGAKA